MSAIKPYNPLDEFQSYSTQFILLASRTTEKAKAFTSESADILTAVNNTTKLGDPVVYGDSTNDVYLLIDTRRFSQFTIENVRYDVLINGLQKSASTSNLATDLSMTVLDAVGISFANFMQWLMDEQMKTNYDGMIFLLKTVFVGHNADGSTTTVSSETIPMHLLRMDIDLTYARGSYTLEFMPNMNFDVSRNARLLTISTATTCSTGKGNKLGALIDSLETNLNTKSKKFYDEVQAIVAASTKPGNQAKTVGRLVQYQITIPESWQDWEVAGASIGGTLETKFFSKEAKNKTSPETSSSTSGSVKDSYAATARGASITDALDSIFKQVSKIAEMANFTQSPGTDGFITFYKHIVGLTSDDKTVVVHVDVVEFKVPNVVAQKAVDTAASTSLSANDSEFYVTVNETDSAGNPTGVQKKIPKDFLEWDYIYTGKNDSILDMEIKIQDFQFLLASNLRAGDFALRGASDTTTSPDSTGQTDNDDLLYARDYDPLILPMDPDSALKNFKNRSTFLKSEAEGLEALKKMQQYTKNLSMFYAASPITVSMTIRGNPTIMHKFNMGQILGHPSSTSTSAQTSAQTYTSKKEYRANLENDILKLNSTLSKSGTAITSNMAMSNQTYATSPVFAKVNIMGPNIDLLTSDFVENADFATKLLIDNFYVVFRVTNIIQNGAFTQELELYSHNVFGRTKITKA